MAFSDVGDAKPTTRPTIKQRQRAPKNQLAQKDAGRTGSAYPEVDGEDDPYEPTATVCRRGLSSEFVERLLELRTNLEQVIDDAVGRVLKNGCFRIFVDRDDDL